MQGANYEWTKKGGNKRKLTKKKIGIIAVCLVLLSSIMVGCIERETQEPAATTTQVEQVLTIGYAGDLKLSGDPSKISRSIPKFVVLERLLDYNLGKDDFVPSLAERWDIKDGGKTIVFHLKRGIMFSDGTTMDANAVKFTYDLLALKNPDLAPKSSEIIDNYTIAFHFDEGLILNLARLQDVHGLGIMSPNSVEPRGDLNGTLKTLIGTGPFKVVEYKKDQYGVFEPNSYWYKRMGLTPKIKKLVVKTIPDEDTRVMALRSGDVDVLIDEYHGGYDYTPRNQLSGLVKDGLKVYPKNLPFTWELMLNYRKEPFNDVRVRKAVGYAINRDEIVKILGGWVRPADTGIFPPEAPGIKKAGIKYEYNPEKAKEILKELGKEGMTVNLIVDESQGDQILLAQLIQQQLKDVGINVNLDVLERGAYSEKRNSGNYDMMIYYFGGSERCFYMRIFWRFLPPDKPYKYMKPEVVKIAQEIVKEFNKTTREQKFIELYRTFHDEMGVVPLYHEMVTVVANPKVENIIFEHSEPKFYAVSIK